MGVQTCEESGAGFGPCTGCDAASSSSSTGSGGGGGGGGGGMGDTCAGYPAGPYGLEKGDTIANYSFDGFVDATKGTGSVQNVQLCHFYNPAGVAVYSPGSQYGSGAAKPRLLLMAVGTAWASTWGQEATADLLPRYAKYKPLGGEFVALLQDGPSPGVPATLQDLVTWSKKYQASYPTVIDPAQAYTAPFAYPANLIVDLHTMKIVYAVLGVPSATFWNKFEVLLN